MAKAVVYVLERDGESGRWHPCNFTSPLRRDVVAFRRTRTDPGAFRVARYIRDESSVAPRAKRKGVR